LRSGSDTVRATGYDDLIEISMRCSRIAWSGWLQNVTLSALHADDVRFV
jgi:hypothetical protein